MDFDDFMEKSTDDYINYRIYHDDDLDEEEHEYDDEYDEFDDYDDFDDDEY